ncbi:MAG: type II secretion system protein [Verrucomicrobiota bacterium]|nr:type II secretion system protein [Verrucomicrobiota bacterium]
MKTTRTARNAGFTLVEVMLVVAIIGLVAAIAIPNFIRARARSQMSVCINNLRLIDGAKQQYILERGVGTTLNFADISPYLGHGPGASVNGVFCPADPNKTFTTSYSIGNSTTIPTCLIDGGNTDYPHVLNN